MQLIFTKRQQLISGLNTQNKVISYNWGGKKEYLHIFIMITKTTNPKVQYVYCRGHSADFHIRDTQNLTFLSVVRTASVV
jgi:hypothetical protein